MVHSESAAADVNEADNFECLSLYDQYGPGGGLEGEHYCVGSLWVLNSAWRHYSFGSQVRVEANVPFARPVLYGEPYTLLWFPPSVGVSPTIYAAPY